MDHHEFWLLVPLSIAIWKHLSIVRIQSHGHIPEADAYQRCKQIKQGKFPIYIGMTPQALMVAIPSIPMICWLVHWTRSSTDQHSYIKHIYSFITYNSYDIIYIQYVFTTSSYIILVTISCHASHPHWSSNFRVGTHPTPISGQPRWFHSHRKPCTAETTYVKPHWEIPNLEKHEKTV